MDMDELERLARAYVEAHAAMLADDRSAAAWLADNSAAKALAKHYGGQYTSSAMCADVVALIARVRAAEAERDRLRALFDDAGAGEHDVLALVDHYQEEALRAWAERDGIMAKMHALGAEAIEQYRIMGTDYNQGAMDALLAAADALEAHRAESGGR